MKTPNHKPGHIDNPRIHCSTTPWAVRFGHVNDANDRSVALIQDHGFEDGGYWKRPAEEHAANAFLIAAAPELLEALIGMVRKIEAGIHPLTAIDHAKAAIAKATGGAE